RARARASVYFRAGGRPARRDRGPGDRPEVFEAPVPPRALREPQRSRAGLAGCDDLEPAPGLVLQRGLEVERPLLVRRQPVAAQAALWEPGQGVREPDRLGQGRTWLDEAIG